MLLLSTAIVITGDSRDAPLEKTATDSSSELDSPAGTVATPPMAPEDDGVKVDGVKGDAAAKTTEVVAKSDESSDEATSSNPVTVEEHSSVEPNGVEPNSGESPVESASAENSIAAAAAAAAEIPLDERSLSRIEEKEVRPVYAWAPLTLMGLTLLLLVRLIFDESFTRRPRLDQNLNQAGITFLCIPAFGILMFSVLSNPPVDSTFKAMEHGRALLQRRDVPVNPAVDIESQPAPTETLIAAGGTAMAQLSGNLPEPSAEDSDSSVEATARLARVLVVVAHTLVVLGLLTIGRQHFASLQLGISMSCLYILLPCTAVNVHELNHVLPAACLVWAIASYRNPVVSGILLGLASGTLFFAAFLLPLWAVFYGRQGALRFVVSVLGVTAVLIASLLLISGDANSFTSKLVTTANWTVYRLLDDSATATDGSLSQLFIRIPMAAIFFVMLTAMTVLPRPRNLENLLANSTSLVVAAQMWYPDDIGTYVLWYLPLFLIVIFRPRLDRFTPPDAIDRDAATQSTQTPVAPTSTMAI